MIELRDFKLIKPERQAAYIGAAPPMWELKASMANSSRKWTRKIPRDVAKKLTFKDDAVMTQEDLLSQLENLEKKAGLNRVIKAVSRSDKSTYAMRDKLKREGYRDTSIDFIIKRSEELSILDNKRYIEAYISSKRRAGWGERKITQYLIREGFNQHFIEDAFYNLQDEGESELERATRVISRMKVPEKDPIKKLAAKLLRRGFSPTISFQVAKHHCEIHKDSENS